MFGTLCAIATIGSSLLLMSFGGRIDYRPRPGCIYRTVALRSVASVGLGLVGNSLFKALSLSSLGFSVGESVSRSAPSSCSSSCSRRFGLSSRGARRPG